MNRFLRQIPFILFVWLTAFSGILTAKPLPPPSESVLLTIAGEVENVNASWEAKIDINMLGELPVHQIKTTTPWTDGVQLFEGVLLKDILELVGATKGASIEAYALNDYHYGIDAEMIRRYPVLVAWSQNGERLRVRGKGPLWIVFPLDDYSELNRPEVHSAMVWQLFRIEVK